MTLYAKINEDLTVGGYVDIEDPSTIPSHKKRSDGGLFLRPVVQEDYPSTRPELNEIAQTVVVNADTVTLSYSVTRRSNEHCVAIVKNEARNRILERYPDWKQTNMVARGVELQDLWRLNGSWTKQEQMEADALQSAWDWIKDVRNASNTIEALDEVPENYDDDSRWPA